MVIFMLNEFTIFDNLICRILTLICEMMCSIACENEDQISQHIIYYKVNTCIEDTHSTDQAFNLLLIYYIHNKSRYNLVITNGRWEQVKGVTNTIFYRDMIVDVNWFIIKLCNGKNASTNSK